nr:unnamed protein product [Spirometra erinaceieuropaei]
MRISTTTYHPSGTGIFGRFHRRLKTDPWKAENSANCSTNLPLARLDIHVAPKSDLDHSAAELTFGATLRLPGEMFTPTPRGADESPDNFVPCLRQLMRSLSSDFCPHSTPPTESYFERGLAEYTHVFIWDDLVR